MKGKILESDFLSLPHKKALHHILLFHKNACKKRRYSNVVIIVKHNKMELYLYYNASSYRATAQPCINFCIVKICFPALNDKFLEKTKRRRQFTRRLLLKK